MMRGWRGSGGGLWVEFTWMDRIDGMGVLVGLLRWWGGGATGEIIVQVG